MTYFDISSVVDKDILRFQVAVDDVKGVQVLEGEYHLRRVERRLVFADIATYNSPTSGY